MALAQPVVILGTILTLWCCPTGVHTADWDCIGRGECFCRGNGAGTALNLTCSFNNQGDLDGYINDLKGANSRHPFLYIDFLEFRFGEQTLNLNFITRLNNYDLRIVNSPKLQSIVKYGREPETFPNTARHIFISDTNMTNEAVTNLLSYMNYRTGPLTLSVNGSSLTANDPGSQLIKDLTKFTKLETLILKNNKISALEAEAFVGPLSLKLIDFRGNKMKKLGYKAFRIDRGLETQNIIEVDLSLNELTTDKVEAEFISYGNFGKFGYLIQMRDNLMDSLPKAVFNLILYPEGPVYEMKLHGNKFICDNRMKWMRRLSEEVKMRVDGVQCTNDPGETIFTIDEAKLTEPPTTQPPPPPDGQSTTTDSNRRPPGPAPAPPPRSPGSASVVSVSGALLCFDAFLGVLGM